MTTEAFTPSPVHVISGVGPYAVSHPYRQDTLKLAVIDGDGVRTELLPADFTAAPTETETTGTVTLTAAAATTHDGSSLYITRETVPEQGFDGQTSRETGLEAQLDWITQGAQDLAEKFKRAALFPDGDTASHILPPLADRLGKIAAYDATTGKPIAVDELTPGTLTATAYAQTLLLATDAPSFAALLQANLAALAGLSILADKGIHGTGAGALALHDQTAFARTLLDDANAAAARETLAVPMERIGTFSASAAASLAITGFDATKYNDYEVRLRRVLRAEGVSGTTSLLLRTSATGGAPFDSGVSDYNWATMAVNSTTSPTVSAAGDDADGQIILSVAGMPGTGPGISGSIEIFEPGAAEWTQMTWDLAQNRDELATGLRRVSGAGSRMAAGAVTAVQLLLSNGSITCEAELWGRRI